MTQVGRRFALSEQTGSGVTCSEKGLFVDDVPLLKLTDDKNSSEQSQPRALSDLNRDLSKRYGLPVDFSSKVGALTAIARALNRGDILHAQIATLHLQVPDPPALTKAVQGPQDVIYLARQLQASGLLKADWNPLKHPRWPAGTPGSIGGEFAPRGDVTDDSASDGRNAPVIPAQLTFPVPFDWVVPREAPVPWPSEVAPGPLAPPDGSPITIPRNPYPGRPKCVREWRIATQDCLDLWADGQLGRDYIRGMGTTVAECITGRVSQDCGGNRVDA
jgi:hypothetical protein